MAPTVPLLIDILSSFGTVADYNNYENLGTDRHTNLIEAALTGTDQSQL